MLAWKQPFIQGVRNSSPVERPGMDNNRALRRPPKPWDQQWSVGEHSGGGECPGRPGLEPPEKQM